MWGRGREDVGEVDLVRGPRLLERVRVGGRPAHALLLALLALLAILSPLAHLGCALLAAFGGGLAAVLARALGLGEGALALRARLATPLAAAAAPALALALGLGLGLAW